MGTLKDIIQGLGNTIGGHPRGYPGWLLEDMGCLPEGVLQACAFLKCPPWVSSGISPRDVLLGCPQETSSRMSSRAPVVSFRSDHFFVYQVCPFRGYIHHFIYLIKIVFTHMSSIYYLANLILKMS
jgi:hypothetical protein